MSTPLSWDEVAAIADGDGEQARFTPDDVLERVHELGDLYTDGRAQDQELPQLAQ